MLLLLAPGLSLIFVVVALCLLQHLESLLLTANQLRGNISSTHWPSLQNLQYLSLAANQFEGKIPTVLLDCTFMQSLVELVLTSNKFDGDVCIPPSECSLPRLASSKLCGVLT